MQESYLIMSNNFHPLVPAKEVRLVKPFLGGEYPFSAIDSHSTSGQFGIANEALYSIDTNTIANRVTALRNPISPSSIGQFGIANEALHGGYTNAIANHAAAPRNQISPASIALTNSNKSINEQLFDATAEVKILTSQVAMHLDSAFREKLFAQIDYLHDHDDWDPEDKPVQKASFATFLRTILYIKPKRFPGLGLSYSGNVIAAWTTGKDRLTIEFLPNDQVKWVLSKYYGDGEVERSASQSSVLRILKCLAPYNPENWLF
jgi:hypothetical protein